MTKRSFTLAELASMTKSKVVGDPHKRVTNIADLSSADENDVSFLSNPKYEKAMRASKAGVVFVSPAIALDEGRNYLINEDPSRAYQQTIESFLGDALRCTTGFTGIHPSAVIHPSASIGANATIAPHAVIDANVKIGDNVFIGAGTYVGMDVTIGHDCYLHPHVTIRERCQIGNRVILQSGAVIGSCGFGYTTDAQGKHAKLNQVGIVILEDDVEIGANTTIDRSRFKETSIGQGTKIDNLVQIGHGVTIGRHCIIVAQTGIAGSTKIGNHVVIAGQVAIAGHLTIADQVTLSGRSGVSKSIKAAGVYGGVPVVPIHEYNRTCVYLRNIATYVKEIESVNQRLKTLETKHLV